MVYRLSAIILSLFLVAACGKNITQTPSIEHVPSALEGFWVPADADQSAKLPALALDHDACIAFVYPMQGGPLEGGHEQAQSVHTTIPLSWKLNKQELSITTLHIDKKTASGTDALVTSRFTYAVTPSAQQDTTLTLTPQNQGAEAFTTRYEQDNAAMGTIQGSLFYRERMMLPPDAVAIITLQEISRADAPAIILSSMAIGNANRTPLSFEIPYRKSDIMDTQRYSLRAYIVSEGSLLFTTTTAYPVLRKDQRDNPASVDMLLHRVIAEDDTQTNLQNTYWALQSLRGQEVQLFKDQDTPHMVLTNDGKSNGSDGCNRFFGSYSTHEHRISFFPGGNTLMLCPQGDKQAAEFMATLQEATAYKIKDQNLELLRGKDVIARFTAQPMPE